MKRKENLEKRRKFYILAILIMVLLITSFIAVVKLSSGEFIQGILNFNSAEDKELEPESTNSVEQENEKTEESDSKETTTNLVSTLTSSKEGIFSLPNPSKTTLSSTELIEGEATNSGTTSLTASVSMESIVQGFRDQNLADGDYDVIINGVTYTVELKNYYDDVHYTTSNSPVYLGNSTADQRMLVVKYHKNLTIDAGVVVTATTRKKGMYICVLGKTVNNGEITMTARGSTAAGQNVYLYKNKDNSYEYVPATGASGLPAVKYGKGAYVGTKGNNGTNRASGSGGQGAYSVDGKSGSAGSYVGSSSAGSAYAGGSGSGGMARWNLAALAASYTEASGTTGGNGSASDSSSSTSIFAGGGAGVVGGASKYKKRAITESDEYGESGAGGLLILYTDVLENKGTISSKGSHGAGAWFTSTASYAYGGGGSGGGSINIFYNYMTASGQYTAAGGAGGDTSGCAKVSTQPYKGGDGGNGCVTLTDLKEYGFTKGNEYIRKNETMRLYIENKREPDEVINTNQFTWTSSNPDIATVSSNGVVTGKSIGRTTITADNGNRIKVKAIINVYSNNPKAKTVPQAEEGTNVSIVLKEDGTVWSTGSNSNGRAGLGSLASVNIPTQVKVDRL